MARRHLRPLDATVVEVADEADLPFPAASFDLVVSRHPVLVRWDEIARVLQPGGVYLAQHIGAGSNRALTDAMMGPQPVDQGRSPQRAIAAAEAAGLSVVDLREQTLRVTFTDIGAVVHFLRKVLWTVPPASRLRGIATNSPASTTVYGVEGPFVSHAQRFLIEAPGSHADSCSQSPC